MEEARRIYSLLLRSNGLKIREIAQALELDVYFVAELMFSEDCSSLWYQNNSSLWFAIEGVMGLETQVDESDSDPNRVYAIELEGQIKPLDLKRYLELGVNDISRKLLIEISKYQVFTDGQCVELLKFYRDGDKRAYELLVKSNLRIVASIAHRYLFLGIPFEDLFQEGTFGLLYAIKYFNETYNSNFSFFVKRGILHSIDMSIHRLLYRVVIPPRHIYYHKLIRRFCDQYEQQNEFEPSLDMIEITENVSQKYLKPIYDLHYDLNEIMVSQNDWDKMADESYLPDGDLMDGSLRFELLRLVNALPERTCDIITSYYGLDNRHEMSLEELGKKYNLTRERMRQIREKGIRNIQRFLGLRRTGSSERIKEGLKQHKCNQFTLSTDENKGVAKTTQGKNNNIRLEQIKDIKSKTSVGIYKGYKQTITYHNETKHTTISKPKYISTPKKETEKKPLNQSSKFPNKAIVKKLVIKYLSKKKELHAFTLAVLIKSDLHIDYLDVDKLKLLLDRMDGLNCTNGGAYYIKGQKPVVVAEDGKSDVVKPEVRPLRQKTLFKLSTPLQQLVRMKVISSQEYMHCHRHGLETIDDVLYLIQKYNLTRKSTLFTEYSLGIWFRIKALLDDHHAVQHINGATSTETTQSSVFDSYCILIEKMRQHKAHGVVNLAKPALLLALIDGIDAGVFHGNQFQLNDWLEKSYNQYLRQYADNQFTPITYPFWNLKGDGFWHIHLKSKNIDIVLVPTSEWIQRYVEYTSFDVDLWLLLQDKNMLKKLRNFIIEHKLLGDRH